LKWDLFYKYNILHRNGSIEAYEFGCIGLNLLINKEYE